MVSFPPCKINLGLQVLSKQPDGFHQISTCFCPLPWTDVLEVLPSNQMSFTQTGFSIPGNPDDNLCLKAYQVLKDDFELSPVQIHLHKIIPTGAGLGGGSSDGAHTLRLLNTVFDLKIKNEDLAAYASRLGSDCAFFIYDEPMLGEDRGQILSKVKLSLKGYYVRVFKPDVHISTAEAYGGITPKLSATSVDEIISTPVSEWKSVLVNDFELSVFEKHPILSEIKNELYHSGALYASMSGSGSAVFGIFKDDRVTHTFSMEEIWSGRL